MILRTTPAENGPAAHSPAARRPLRIVLTGGIASGKSTVARLFEQHGVPVLDTDQIARDIVEPGMPAAQAIAQQFGPRVIGPDGRLDRRALRDIVFADTAARRQLEAITHPLILAELERRSQRAGGSYQLLVVPLLVENGKRVAADRVLVVDCPESLQLQRVMARDGSSLAQAQAILAAQATRAARLAAADDVIVNDGDSQHLHAAVQVLHQRFLAAAAAIAPG